MKTSGFNIIKETWCVILSLVKICSCKEFLPTCFSDIYCHGSLLHTIQMSKISEDSKTFVDMKMIHSPKATMEYFNEFMKDFKGKQPNKNEVKGFVNKYFEREGQELENWTPSDWIPRPEFVDKIKDVELRKWAIYLNRIWKLLGKKIKDDVKSHQDHYSIIWVPNPFVVPGGRFREFYYWDTYWIVQGLLLSEMYNTTKGVLENFLYIVDRYGSIPNGGRIYYLARSQPPLLIQMIKLYLDVTHDIDFISKHIHLMEKEFDYWMTSHSKIINKDGVKYTLAIYGDKSKGPRPESYSEDIETAAVFKEDSKKEELYSEIKAAAESGWDFSSRWFIKNASNKGNLTDLKTRSIVPVDLNAILCGNAKLLAEFNSILKNDVKAKKFNNLAETWIEAVTAVLWHEEIGAWLDYDILNEVKRNYFYPTNIAPLWTGCYNPINKAKIVQNVLNYLRKNSVLYPGGVPTTFEHSGEQWDYPNAWPPLQHIMIMGLHNTCDDRAMSLAYKLAKIWIRSNFKAFEETNEMYEKYDATVPGGHGGGGEYEIQKGFGWTNGVVMDLLSRYASELTHGSGRANTEISSNASFSIIAITTVLIAAVTSLTVGLIQ